MQSLKVSHLSQWTFYSFIILWSVAIIFLKPMFVGAFMDALKMFDRWVLVLNELKLTFSESGNFIYFIIVPPPGLQKLVHKVLIFLVCKASNLYDSHSHCKLSKFMKEEKIKHNNRKRNRSGKTNWHINWQHKTISQNLAFLINFLSAR